jgi:hypothetical protein
LTYSFAGASGKSFWAKAGATRNKIGRNSAGLSKDVTSTINIYARNGLSAGHDDARKSAPDHSSFNPDLANL